MKKNYFFSLWLRAFSCTTTMTMLFTALMALMTNTTKTFAQTKGTQYEAADNIDQLVGIDPGDPSDSNNAYLSGTTMPTDNNKLLYFYNVGTKRFLSPGGIWGTQGSLDNTAYPFWLKASDNSNFFYIVNKSGYLGNGGHIEDKEYLFMDCQGHNFVFEQAPGYTDKNKVYYVKMTESDQEYYAQAYLDDNPTNHTLNKTKLTENDADYKNQVWKIFTKTEYYQLINANPANMEHVIDFSFVIKAFGFRANDPETTNWNATSATDKIFFGDNKQYKTFDNRGKSGSWGGTYVEKHQREFGKLFYTYARGAKDFIFYQDITVHKAGWYLLRCNGFTTQVNKDGRVSARLMMAMVTNKEIDKRVYSAATLNKLPLDTAKVLMQSDASGTGAGRAFFNGKYENQVQVCLDEKDLKAMGIDKIDNDHPVTLRIGYYVGDDCVLQDGDVTCVDNFKLLYAGPRRNPELILDEDQTSLVYLSNAKDVYKNSVLHLRRTFTEGQWNSLILPVDLKFGQMKRTFGDDVKVAKLTSLNNGVVTFTTVEPTQDSDKMVTAFEPYIIKPTSLTEDLGLPYTADKFYTKLDKATGEISNAEWLGADGKRVSTDDNDRFSLTIPAGHYDITMVTLDRKALIEHIDMEKENWISSTSFSASAQEGDLTCYGTLTKTYGKDENGKDAILPGRDNLSGAYVMRGGQIVQVPSNKEYGLKGFRCWFEFKGKMDGIAAAPRLEIDGIIDDATSIDDLNSQPSQFTSRHKGISGVFNLDGQKVRDGESTQDLPKGIYIVNGRKVVVR